MSDQSFPTFSQFSHLMFWVMVVKSPIKEQIRIRATFFVICIFYRPGVAGDVLQTPVLLIDSFKKCCSYSVEGLLSLGSPCLVSFKANIYGKVRIVLLTFSKSTEECLETCSDNWKLEELAHNGFNVSEEEKNIFLPPPLPLPPPPP